VHTPPSVRKIVRQRVAAVTVSVLAAGLLLGITSSAGAAPAPTVSQVQAKLKSLELKLAQYGQQYDQVKQELASTDQRLALINSEIAQDNTRFAAMRQEITRIAVTAYEDGNLNSSITLLTTGNPQQILDQSSILLELSNTNNAQIRQFLGATRQLANAQLLARRTKAGIVQLKSSEAKRYSAMQKLVASEKSLLEQLTPAQQTGTTGGGGSTTGHYTGPTSTQAEKAVAFAYDQLGCPYVYTMEAWASAGVAIPRTSYEQLDSLPHVSLGDQEPGDILVFLGGAHVGIYVGGGKLIDAPQTGEDVELVSFSGWYMSNLYAIVRPKRAGGRRGRPGTIGSFARS
jgi:cell wall-associated NlpC family hydrolase